MNKPSPNMYIPHIDGLRAFAVLAVLFFHFELAGFGAGYLGVDIFFTISGFLVSRIIIKDIEENGTFRFKRFFVRRVRRLFPALAVVCFLTALASYLFLDAERLSAFGLSLSAAIISFSNILFWTQSGYFDVDAVSKPLLHTWSLSVEEQFYLVWPLTLAFGYKLFQKKALKIISLSAFILSIALVLLWTFGKFDVRADSTVFYWMPFRIFEFMLGALAVIIFPLALKKQNVFVLVGVFAILAAFILPIFTGFEYGPVLGFLACLGTALIMVSPQALISTSILQLSSVRWLGRISYSLYLVHWPVWIFAPEFLKENAFAFLTLTIVSILITLPIYYGIENPLRRGPKSKSRKDLIAYALIAAILVLLGQYLHRAETLPFRDRAALSAEDIAEGKQKRYPDQNCLITDADCPMEREKQVLIFGNSHEVDGRNTFLHLYGDDDSVNLISFGSINGCKIGIKDDKISSDVTGRNCSRRTAALNELLEQQKLTHVVYSANYPFSSTKSFFWEAFSLIKQTAPNIELIVMGGFLNTKKDCSTLVNERNSFDACFVAEDVQSFNTNERAKFKTSVPYLYIDLIGAMCPERTLDSCAKSGYGEPVFYDKSHRSFGYSKLMSDRIRKNYADELSDIGLDIQ